MVIFSSVVQGISLAEFSVYLGVNIGLSFKLLLNFIQDLETVVMLTKLESFLSDSNTEQEDSIMLSMESSFSGIKEFNGLLKIYQS